MDLSEALFQCLLQIFLKFVSVAQDHLSLEIDKPLDELISASAFVRDELQVHLFEFLSFFKFDLLEGHLGVNLLFAPVANADDT